MPLGWGEAPEMRWEQPSVGGRSPSARAGHSMTVVPSADGGARVVMFGGCSAAGPDNKTFILAVAGDARGNGELRWVAGRGAVDGAGALRPAARWRHSATLVGASTVCVFGGSTDDTRLSDLWLLDTEAMVWSRPLQTVLPEQQQQQQQQQQQAAGARPEPVS